LNEEALYHFSEEAGIEVFEPRSPLARPEVEPLVWAVDAWHAPHFFFPRDCPRVNFWAGPKSSPEAIQRLLGPAPRAAAIEEAWLERLRTTRLYRYRFDPGHFESLGDAAAGYFVARSAVRPLKVDVLEDLPAHLARAGVELRVLESGLVAFHLQVVASSLEFSSSRLRNAADAHLLSES
jgi:hypothetical protein